MIRSIRIALLYWQERRAYRRWKREGGLVLMGRWATLNGRLYHARFGGIGGI